MADVEALMKILETNKTAEEHAICSAAFHSILCGEPIGFDDLATALGYEANKLRNLLDGLVARGLIVVDPVGDRVIGSWGLSNVPTAHRLRIRDFQLFAWCALDAVGIPAGMGEDATVDSACHLCGSALRVELKDGHVERAHPPGIWLWLTGCEEGRSVVGFT